MILRLALLAATLTCSAIAQTPAPAQAPGQPTHWPTQDFTEHLPNFHFKDGQTLPDLTLHGLTLGKLHRDAQGHATNAVLLLHGTGGDAHSLLNPVFSDVLFGPGQPLDITKFFIILPDDIGHGQSSKPSDGLHAAFPKYDYDDMVTSQHQMLVESLHVDHLRLILGTSMGCMQSFVWGETYPTFADALAPFACEAVPLAGRNRMWRYMAISAIKNDPAYLGGDYKSEPLQGITTANDLLLLAGSVPLQMQKSQGTRAQAESYVDNYLKRADAAVDANNMIWYINASRNYDPSANLAKIQVPVLWINSADDFINPPELGLPQQQVKQMPNAKFILIPISDATRGHGTHTQAALWKDDLVALLARSQR